MFFPFLQLLAPFYEPAFVTFSFATTNGGGRQIEVFGPLLGT